MVQKGWFDLFEVNASMRTLVLKVRISRSLLWDLDTQILTPQMHRDGLSWFLHFSQKAFYLQKLRDHSSGPGRAARDGKVIQSTWTKEYHHDFKIKFDAFYIHTHRHGVGVYNALEATYKSFP